MVYLELYVSFETHCHASAWASSAATRRGVRQRRRVEDHQGRTRLGGAHLPSRRRNSAQSSDGETVRNRRRPSHWILRPDVARCGGREFAESVRSMDVGSFFFPPRDADPSSEGVAVATHVKFSPNLKLLREWILLWNTYYYVLLRDTCKGSIFYSSIIQKFS